mmetsp:Transcript_5250/g.33017  ORF Transcript_5250/g.33017 Transcript_5250/m.33017 type:complete len:303 (+) Transcript_5250:288-1196(+)
MFERFWPHRDPGKRSILQMVEEQHYSSCVLLARTRSPQWQSQAAVSCRTTMQLPPHMALLRKPCTRDIPKTDCLEVIRHDDGTQFFNLLYGIRAHEPRGILDHWRFTLSFVCLQNCIHNLQELVWCRAQVILCGCFVFWSFCERFGQSSAEFHLVFKCQKVLQYTGFLRLLPGHVIPCPEVEVCKYILYLVPRHVAFLCSSPSLGHGQHERRREPTFRSHLVNFCLCLSQRLDIQHVRELLGSSSHDLLVLGHCIVYFTEGEELGVQGGHSILHLSIYGAVLDIREKSEEVFVEFGPVLDHQ